MNLRDLQWIKEAMSHKDNQWSKRKTKNKTNPSCKKYNLSWAKITKTLSYQAVLTILRINHLYWVRQRIKTVRSKMVRKFSTLPLQALEFQILIKETYPIIWIGQLKLILLVYLYKIIIHRQLRISFEIVYKKKIIKMDKKNLVFLLNKMGARWNSLNPSKLFPVWRLVIKSMLIKSKLRENHLNFIIHRDISISSP